MDLDDMLGLSEAAKQYMAAANEAPRLAREFEASSCELQRKMQELTAPSLELQRRMQELFEPSGELGRRLQELLEPTREFERLMQQLTAGPSLELQQHLADLFAPTLAASRELVGRTADNLLTTALSTATPLAKPPAGRPPSLMQPTVEILKPEPTRRGRGRPRGSYTARYDFDLAEMIRQLARAIESGDVNIQQWCDAHDIARSTAYWHLARLREGRR